MAWKQKFVLKGKRKTSVTGLLFLFATFILVWEVLLLQPPAATVHGRKILVDILPTFAITPSPTLTPSPSPLPTRIPTAKPIVSSPPPKVSGKILFGIGSQAGPAMDFRIVKEAPVHMLSSWYNGPSDLEWMRVQKNDLIPRLYANHYVVHLITWTDLPEEDIQTPHGPACGRPSPALCQRPACCCAQSCQKAQPDTTNRNPSGL